MRHRDMCDEALLRPSLVASDGKSKLQSSILSVCQTFDVHLKGLIWPQM